MAGRGYLWFLEARQGSRQYQDFYEDVQASLSNMTYRALLGFAIDLRLWPEASQLKDSLTKFNASWHEDPQPQWLHYRELTGKTLAVYSMQGQDYFEFVVDNHNNMITLPLKAIVSYRSTGFPKVAYAIEQYVQGYVQWLDALTEWIQDEQAPLMSLQSQLRKENFSERVFEELIHLVRFCLEGKEEKGSLLKHLKTLTFTMARSMIEEVSGRCKPPYHHPIEWNTPRALLQKEHLLVRTYLMLRAVYPTMVVGTIQDAFNEKENTHFQHEE